MHASQVISRPRQVRVVGVIQLAVGHPAFASPAIPGPGQIELVWRQFSVEDIDDTFDLLVVCAMNVPAALVTGGLSRIRSTGWHKGLIVWMDRSQLPAAARFIAAGATDFILADTDKDEASWRLHAALPRTSPPEPPAKPIPGVTLDWKQHAVVMGETRVSLTLRELQLVDVMLQAQTPIPSLALAQKAWGRVPSGSANLVSVCVCNLRKKLARFGSAFGIRTHRGAGYSVEVRRS